VIKERTTLIGLLGTLFVLVLLAAPMAAQTPQTTKEKTQGAPTVTTEEMRGEVVKVEGNTLVVKMESGELRTFSNVPDSRTALIDGKEVGVRDLRPGTKLTATVTRTATPVTVRTTTVGTGRVFFVSGNNVILTLPNGENKQYQVKPDYKFIVGGKPATVRDLRPGMTVSAEKIVEEPTVEIATNTEVVGEAPASGRAASAAAAPARAAVPGAAKAPAAASAHPGTLPKTGGPVPLMGLLGLLFAGGSVALRRFRRS
jgi:LPXTG-motif cell wall-anchored protein